MSCLAHRGNTSIIPHKRLALQDAKNSLVVVCYLKQAHQHVILIALKDNTNTIISFIKLSDNGFSIVVDRPVL